MLIDTHCHLNFNAFENDLDDVVRRAQKAGVERIIVPGTDLSSSREAIKLAQNYSDFIFAAVGIHPHHAQDSNLVVDSELKKQLEELVTNDRVVAVGEIGLDYYRYSKTKYSENEISIDIKTKQKELFTMQHELGVIHKKPVILHCREAFDDMIQTISTFSRSHSPTPTVKPNYIKLHHFTGVWHCFTGSAKQLQDILTMGYYVGFDGNITYKNSISPSLVSATPLDKLLLETDAPFLTPVPHRGTRNEPVHLPLVAQAVADFKSTPLPQVEKQTSINAQALFHLS